MIKKINFPVIIILAFFLFSMSAISGCSTPEGAAKDKENELKPAEAEQINLEDFSADNITINAEIKTSEYPFSYEDSATGITMYWYNDSENLYIGLESQAQGWTSIGFGPEASMKGANIIMLAVEDGGAAARDDYGNSGFSTPRMKIWEETSI